MERDAGIAGVDDELAIALDVERKRGFGTI
jgi:hypothetical protein